jgi:predicted DNA-binding transcriptional regulator YafY
MRDPDHWCVTLNYRSSKGALTKRTISPIRFLDDKASQFLALCLCREEPRQFVTDRCSSLELVRAEDVLMPMPIEEVDE